MAIELVNWAKDISRYFTRMPKRVVSKWTTGGIDYAGDQYDDAVRRTVDRLHPKTMKLRVEKIIEETGTTKTFRFARIDGEFPPFRAGQYINLFVDVGNIATSRPYSISSKPQAGYLDVTVREKTDGFVSVHLIQKVKEGDLFTSSGPGGHFYHEPLSDRGELVFIAGGSGITPLMSMLRQHALNGWPVKTHLIYGSRNLDDVIFKDELDELSAGNDSFNYALVLSEPESDFKGVKGFITDHIIKSHVGDVAGKTFYICGPTVMYDFCLKQMAKLKIPRHKIKRELFGPPDDVTAQPGWPKKVKADSKFDVAIVGQRVITAAAGEPLLNSLERNGIKAPTHCRSGECSYCRMRLQKGKVFTPPNTGVRDADREYGFIHPCVSYPVEPLEISLS